MFAEAARNQFGTGGVSSLLVSQLETNRDGVLIVDPGGHIVLMNKRMADLWGVSRTEVLGELINRKLIEIALPMMSDPKAFKSMIRSIYESKTGVFTDLIPLKDGRWFERYTAPIFEDGQYTGRIWYFHDATEQQRALQYLRQSEDRLRHFFNVAIEGLFFHEHGKIIDANPALVSMMGYGSREEVVGLRILDHVPPESVDLIREYMMKPEVPRYEVLIQRKDGSSFMAEIRARQYQYQGREMRVVSVHDLTERKRMENELVRLNADLEARVKARTELLEREIESHRRTETSLRLSELKFRELVETANSIIMRMDKQGRITYLNEYGQSFFGFKEEEIIGKNIVGTIVPKVESGGRDLSLLMSDLFEHPSKYTNNLNENVRKNGERVWIAWTNRVTTDEKGELTGLLSVGNDITRLKEAEHQLSDAKERAESADRIKSAFLATMSHELRTPLNSIVGFTGLLLMGLVGPLNDEQKKQLGMVKASASHLLALINDVLDISKIEAGQLEVRVEPVDFLDAVEKAVQIARPLAEKKGLTFQVSVSANIGTIQCDRRRVEQVLLNLLSNAIKFTDKGGITVTCEEEDGGVITRVVDTGIGIKKEDQNSLFKPFKQLDTGISRQREGTGLGLSISKKLVEKMGGSVFMESEFGKGSTFGFILPRGVARL